MSFTLATWNINSVRLREPIVLKLLQEEAPDILCLQECKSPVEKIPTEGFAELGYGHMVARGQKGYNGVAILSKRPIRDVGDKDFASLGHARHIAGELEDGTVIHNFYVPAGGDVPDREKNEKFGQKLDYLTEMRDWFHAEKPKRSILVGDLNIAPREDDVWSHKQLLKVVSHTPIEVEHLAETQDAGGLGGHHPSRHIPRVCCIAGGLIGPAIGMRRTRGGAWIMSGRRRISRARRIPAAIMREARGWEKPSRSRPGFCDV